MRAKAHEAPDHLSDRSKALWNEVIPSRARSSGRIALIRMALEELDQVDAARAALHEQGLTTTTITTGAVHLNPLTKVVTASQTRFLGLWSKLGFDHDSSEDPE